MDMGLGKQTTLTNFGMTIRIFSNGKWWEQSSLLDFFPLFMEEE
jgi:hypothetical protein